jgi:hypothetical protein
MIVEIRIYKIRPGMRSRFVEFFERKTLAPQRALGMKLFGQFTALEDETTFVWLRGFESLEERDRLKREFYEGPLWKEELEAEAFSMIEDYSNVILAAPTPASAIQ